MDRFVVKRKTPPFDIDLDDLPWDPAKRKRIISYHPNQRDEVRRKYLTRGPCQPRGHLWRKIQIFACVVTYSEIKLKIKGLNQHAGSDVNSFHNNAKRKCEYLMRQGQSIKHALHKQSDVVKNDYRIRLYASIDVSRHLLHQGLPFCGHDESDESANRGNFLELLKYTAGQNNAPIQKDIEQMTMVFRFVDKYGIVKKRFVGVIHVKETSSLSLKCAIDSLFAKYGLSMKKVRGKGYDGAIVMAVAKKHFEVGEFFDMISVLLNVVGASCKRKDMIRENYKKIVEEGINNGEIKTGTGLNQEISLQRPENTRWVKVLEYIQDEGTDSTKRQQAYGILKYFHTFDFVFYLHLMLFVMGLTDSLSKALQRKDQDILNAISLVESTKSQLQKLRDDGWDAFMAKICSFCEQNDIGLVIMEEDFVDSRRPRKKTGITNLHHYKVDCFYNVLDMQLQEFNDGFDEFDKSLLMRLAEFYPEDFSFMERKSLDLQLEIYLDNVQRDERFTDLKSLSDLARVMVETRKHISHPLILNTITNESVIRRFQDMSER
ncbi:PREDICTED: uncharacterized protein LOC104754107 [Camelina sativa]|uniref:Uncharacterized protein LOC104754107 n=1 Tax=Camelina sativa TaxID=90675 RepID=A0ABM1R322_CAMSA|nr:PREDICTED: uncharacterized protein LOC104754107 [Camelina sativa]